MSVPKGGWSHHDGTSGTPGAAHWLTILPHLLQTLRSWVGLAGSRGGQGDAVTHRPPASRSKEAELPPGGKMSALTTAGLTQFNNIAIVCAFKCVGCIYMQHIWR